MKIYQGISLLCLGASVAAESTAFAGCHEGVTYHGRIVTKIHRSCCGASPAPATSVFVQQSPSLMGVPYVTSAPMVFPSVSLTPTAVVPIAAAAPVAPAAPAANPTAAPAAQSDLDELRASVAAIRSEVTNLTLEVRTIRQSLGPK